MRAAFLASITLVAGAASCARPSTPAATEASAEDTTLTDGTTPVLAHDGPADPRAARVCHALFGVPTERRAACCSAPSEDAAPPAVSFPVSLATDIEAECSTSLTALLARGAVTLAESDIESCEAAQRDALEGCGWVRPLPPERPAACLQLLAGTLDEGARCSSSLECEDGLRCHGASALSLGRCGKPKPERMPCGAALDPMALSFGVAAVDADHPECDGRCVLGRCAATGAKPAVAHVASWHRELADGACRNDLDCARGGCVKPAGAGKDALGTCAMKCRAL